MYIHIYTCTKSTKNKYFKKKNYVIHIITQIVIEEALDRMYHVLLIKILPSTK